MIFAPFNATVIEFGLQPQVDRCFGHMAMALGLEYWLFPQMSTHLYLKYKADDNNVAALMKLLRYVLERKGLRSLLRHDEL